MSFLLSAVQQRLNTRFDLLGCGLRFESLDDVTRTVHQEFGEVPGDVTRLSGLEQIIERAGAIPVDLDFFEHRERNVELRLSERQDLFVAARFLGAKLVARKRQDAEALIFICFVEGTQTCVLRRESSATGDVDDQAEAILKLRQAHRVPGDQRHFDTMEFRHGSTPLGLVGRS